MVEEVAVDREATLLVDEDGAFFAGSVFDADLELDLPYLQIAKDVSQMSYRDSLIPCTDAPCRLDRPRIAGDATSDPSTIEARGRECASGMTPR